VIGATLGRYQIVGEVGRGGFATVYQGYDAGLQRPVALKVLHPELVRDEVALRRFQREAVAVARLRHPNIVVVYEFSQQDGFAYIAMEYIEGTTLKAKLGQPLPLDEAVRIASDVASALEYAHKNGVVHRDIKPANVLLTAENHVVLADFGIAILAQNADSATRGLLGTPQYMAPEQALGEPIDARSDLYALGIVLFEMLAGQVPFRGDTPLATLALQVNAPVPKLRSFNPAVPESVEAMVERALAKDPAQRYPTAEEFRQALLAACDQARNAMAVSTYTPEVVRGPGARVEARGGGLPGLYQAMLEAAQAGDWQQVLEYGRVIRGMDPNYRDVVALMARASAQQYAEQSKSGAIELRLLEQARTAWADERWADAVHLFEQALRLAPPTQEVEEALNEARRRLAQSEAQARQRARAERQYIRAAMLLDEERWAEAIPLLEQLLQLVPNFRDAPALLERARAAWAEQERRQRNLPTPETTLARAEEAMALGDWPQAVALLEAVAAALPDDDRVRGRLEHARAMVQVTALNAEAAQLVQQGRWAEAFARLEEAKRLDPHYRQQVQG
jgi:tetratricopeptide (TPR) repeat protein